MRKFFQIYSNRINNLTLCIFSFSIILLSFFFKIQIIHKDEIKKTVHNKGYREIDVYGKRGQILDIKSRKLSESINKYSFWINTNKNFNLKSIVEEFSLNFNKPESFYLNILNKKIKEVPCLLFEDFNTTGITGDPDIHKRKIDKKRNDFYAFWWSILSLYYVKIIRS